MRALGGEMGWITGVDRGPMAAGFASREAEATQIDLQPDGIPEHRCSRASTEFPQWRRVGWMGRVGGDGNVNCRQREGTGIDVRVGPSSPIAGVQVAGSPMENRRRVINA